MKSVKFEIFALIRGGRKAKCWIARMIDSGVDFRMTELSTLGGIPIKPILTQPRAADKEGKPRFDLFVFYPKQGSDLDRLIEGQIVELVTEGLVTIAREE